MLGVFGVLALVLVATVVVALLFRDNWVVEQFGPNLATELLGIIITVAFVQRLLQREERARKLRATVGALRKGRTALAALIEVWSRLVQGALDPRQTEYPLTIEQLFASYYTEALVHLNPMLAREDAAAHVSLDTAAAQLNAAQKALRDIIFIYGGALDPDYLEAVDELADDAFVALIVELAAVESLSPQEWRVRINTSRGYRESFFIRLLHAIQVHNRLAVEAARFRSHLLAPRAQHLSMRLRPDQDLTVETQLTREWWSEPPGLGALRSRQDARPAPPRPAIGGQEPMRRREP
ncbi:MAG TPA: hypothetical protein VGR27_15300 [Longimicrobiaceae bacterium]|nr:hypothetical protein [Longimicrobiaceae bacterium]